MKKTVMIFGISSFMGSNLAEILGDEYRIVGTYFQTPVAIPGVTCIPLDVLKKDHVSKIVAIFRPSFSIYTVGMSSILACKLNPKKADALNSAGAANCSVASERYGSKFIFFSSCFVLGGDNVIYREGDMPFPNTAFGSSLSSTEFYIQRSSLDYLILRCSPIYGRSFSPLHPNWFEGLQVALAKNETIMVDDSISTGFLDVFILGKVIKGLLTSGVTNRLLQLSSSDFMTRYEFAKLYASIFRKDQNLLKPSTGTFPLDADRKTTNKSATDKHCYRLDTQNLENLLGVSMPKIEDSLNFTHKRLGLRS